MKQEVIDVLLKRKPYDCERNLLLRDHYCSGRITFEHAVYYAGKKIDEPWAVVLLCAWAHEVHLHQDGGGMIKEIGEWIAVNRMTEEDEARYPRKDWAQRRRYLNSKYGVPTID